MGNAYHIISGIPPPADSSLMSVKAHSVVKIIPDTEAAFSEQVPLQV